MLTEEKHEQWLEPCRERRYDPEACCADMPKAVGIRQIGIAVRLARAPIGSKGQVSYGGVALHALVRRKGDETFLAGPDRKSIGSECSRSGAGESDES
jgi:hypothetical protein